MKSTVMSYCPIIVCIVTILLSTAPVYSQSNLLQNPGFEYGNSSWYSTSWGGASASDAVDELRAHSGSNSIKISVNSLPDGGGYFYGQNIDFLPAHTYQAHLWVSSPTGARVQLFLRDNGNYYFTPACKTLQAPPGPNWHEISLQGGFDYAAKQGTFGLYVHSTGTIYVDDASLVDITADLKAPSSPATIPATMFGIHMNHFGEYHGMPSINAGMLRLWDCGCTWSLIEPKTPINGVHTYNWALMDQLVNDAKSGKASVMYTLLGAIPQWASTNPNKPATYGDGSGGPPGNAEWALWLKAVATRYKGRIAYYEICNESDGQFFTGTPQQMVGLTETAHTTIKSIDPSAFILSPNIDNHGVPFLDEFLQDGGGKYCDIISWHQYIDKTPESEKPLVDSLQSLMRNYNIGDKPLFDTEGSGGSHGTDDEFRAQVSRGFMTLWAWGVSNYNWYCWDILNPLCLHDDRTPNAGGIAYRETSKWLVGSRMVAAQQNFDKKGSWLVEIVRPGGYHGYILWNPDPAASTKFVIPSEWRTVELRDLSGTGRTLSKDGFVKIGIVPIMLENRILP